MMRRLLLGVEIVAGCVLAIAVSASRDRYPQVEIAFVVLGAIVWCELRCRARMLLQQISRRDTARD